MSVVSWFAGPLMLVNTISNVVWRTLEAVMDLFVTRIKIDRKNNINTTTVRSFMQELDSKAGVNNVMDGNNSVRFELGRGIHWRTIKGATKNRWVWIYIDDDDIYLYCFLCFDGSLRNYVNNIYKKHNNPQQIIMTFTPALSSNNSSGSSKSWDYPNIRRNEGVEIKIKNMHSSSLAVYDKITQFKSAASEVYYKECGRPYRYGCILSGLKGSGKSTMAEIIAMKFNMPIYEVTLNTDGMCDGVFKKLMTTVPANSLIVFDEFEKQLVTIKDNKNINLSEGGILSGIDGVVRLAHGCIVILTVNDINVLSTDFRENLMRIGRIDAHFELVRS
jgi:hypothetical protein